MKMYSILKTTAFVLAALSFAACGKVNYVSDAQVSATAVNGQQTGTVSVDINTNGLNFTASQLVISSASNPPVPLANIQLLAVTSTTAQLIVSLNLTALAGIPVGIPDATLPDGLQIPATGYNVADLQTFKPTNSPSKLYINLNTAAKEAMVGTAISISEFNTGAQADVFVPFTSKDGTITGTAGIFTGPQTGQSGFAVFLTADALLHPTGSLPSLSGMFEAPHIKFETVIPDKTNAKRMKKMYDQLIKDQTVLHIL
jgi:hypothetical protein